MTSTSLVGYVCGCPPVSSVDLCQSFKSGVLCVFISDFYGFGGFVTVKLDSLGVWV